MNKRETLAESAQIGPLTMAEQAHQNMAQIIQEKEDCKSAQNLEDQLLAQETAAPSHASRGPEGGTAAAAGAESGPLGGA